ncbi:MAG: helix-turn-helix domain-containing protein [Candidatus Faecousia sp.]|nr:helix-turn-helix domain-containing protein [Clostridiales bacterium]MCI6935552.1 helix-turn-helix domain-containing protein [Clostridiales bacterium]MDD5883496.1 helix-turn-helix domain-containing protein [Bacillota bacterium]MDY4599867.1 helix-turn-helix domain-containing protein [Candidatus Faecousia sp.]
MSNSVFQSVIVQLRDISDRVFGVIDTEGCVISCTDMTMLGERWADAALKVGNASDSIVTFAQKSFKAIMGSSNYFEYAVFCSGDDETARSFCQMAFIALNDAKTFYEEKHDRGTFVKNIIMDNILPGDIYIRAKELHFATDAPRAVFLIRQVGHSDVATVDVLTAMFPDKMQDFVLSINETDVAVVKQVSGNVTAEDMEKVAQSMEETLKNELRIKTIIGIGTVAEHLRELADSYKEAQTAIEVGKVFDTEKSIMHYENLGIGRLIYQLPTTLCEIFLKEVFKKNSLDSLDQETLFTINKFFENSLNVSETSRKLFVHRNTLVYRLEKIRKLTGLDLRQFDHAIVFRVALMVRQYLASRENR